MCTGHRLVPDLVVDLHPPAPAQDHVHLLLLLVRVAVRKAIAGRNPLVAQAGFLELERLGRCAELEVRRAVEPRAEVLQILLDVSERERHGAQSYGTCLASGYDAVLVLKVCRVKDSWLLRRRFVAASVH